MTNTEKDEVCAERDREWLQIIESILDFHPVSMTEALNKGIAKVQKWKLVASAAADEVCGDASCGHSLCTAMMRLKEGS